MKTCNKCKEDKDISLFRQHHAVCKSCEYLDQKQYRKDNPDRRAESSKYYAKNKDKIIKNNAIYQQANPDKVSKWRKDYEQRNSLKVAESKKQWIANNPEKRKAHLILDTAIRRNKLERKPCEVCGSLKSEAHHDDYAKPLEVVWLCSKHHKQKHVEKRSEA